MTWPEAVDEALCYGWIDSVRKGIDAESYELGIEYAPEPPFDSGTPNTAPPEVLESARAAVRPLTKSRVMTAKRIAAKLGVKITDRGRGVACYRPGP